MTRLALKLERSGKLRGRALDGEGRPAPKARVEISHLRGGSGRAVRTDAASRFEFIGIGTFTLIARPADGMKPPQQHDDQPTGWAATCYPRAVRRADAERVILRPPGSIDSTSGSSHSRFVTFAERSGTGTARRPRASR